MHQIRFRLGFCPRPCWGSSQPSSWILGGPTSKAGEEGENGKSREGRVKKREAGEEGKKGKWRGGEERRGSPN